ncbi:MAG: 23S rRNA (adenine(2503)-C(2))-methyltransferase RlmN [Bacteroidales bacterium]|nr:23S rRNA (adenine(2503)-C(2))-methyltransferase RlmN [Bacteroidales bacterium]
MAINNENKYDIRQLSIEELVEFFESHKEKAFRAKQVWEWLWKKSVHSFDEMKNIPKHLINLLKEKYVILPIKVNNIQKSKDRTIKFGFSLDSGELIESVLIPSFNRATACISSHAGCNLGCKFCATANIKTDRALTIGEIYDQVIYLKQATNELQNVLFSNIVFMGMGEPLLNYENILTAINRITSDKGLNFSPRRITLSTVGIVKMIKRLGDDKVKFNLAVSLHTANNKKRDILVPVNKTNNLSSLSDAIKYFYDKTGNRTTFEYLLLNNFNDSLKDAKELAQYCKIVPCKINLIEYNPIKNSTFEKSSENNTNLFKEFLESKNLIVNIRRSRGKDIDAACGQLANKISSDI